MEKRTRESKRKKGKNKNRDDGTRGRDKVKKDDRENEEKYYKYVVGREICLDGQLTIKKPSMIAHVDTARLRVRIIAITQKRAF